MLKVALTGGIATREELRARPVPAPRGAVPRCRHACPWRHRLRLLKRRRRLRCVSAPMCSPQTARSIAPSWGRSCSPTRPHAAISNRSSTPPCIAPSPPACALRDSWHDPFVVVDVPLLYETGAEKDFDRVIVTACLPATQLARLRERGLSEEDAQRRLAAQWPTDDKAARADFVGDDRRGLRGNQRAGRRDLSQASRTLNQPHQPTCPTSPTRPAREPARQRAYSSAAARSSAGRRRPAPATARRRPRATSGCTSPTTIEPRRSNASRRFEPAANSRSTSARSVTCVVPTSTTAAPGLTNSRVTNAGPADRGHEDVGRRRDARQIDGARMADRHGRVPVQQQQRHRLADDVAAADDDRAARRRWRRSIARAAR